MLIMNVPNTIESFFIYTFPQNKLRSHRTIKSVLRSALKTLMTFVVGEAFKKMKDLFYGRNWYLSRKLHISAIKLSFNFGCLYRVNSKSCNIR